MQRGENNSDPDWLERCHQTLESIRDRPEAGLSLAHELIKEARRSAAPFAQRSADVVLAFADYYLGRLEQAESEFARLALRCEIEGDQRVFALCSYGLLRILRKRGMLHEAYELGHQRILSNLPAMPARETVLVLNLLGIVAQGCGHTDEAMRHLYRALEMARSLNLTKRIAQITANISEIFYVSGNVEDAENMLAEAKQAALASNETWLTAYVSSLLALSKLAVKKYDEAYLAVADYIAGVRRGDYDNAPNIANRSFCLAVAAYTLAMRDELEEAEALCAVAMGLLEQFDDRQLKPYTWWVRGHLDHRYGRIEQAIGFLTKALGDAGEKGFAYLRLRAIAELTEIYAEQGQWQKAYHEQLRYHALFAQSQDQATRGRLQTLRARSELKNAENARRLAEQGMAERKHLADSLKQSLAERETILEHSIVGIALLTSDGRVHWANRAMVEMFGVRDGAYLGKSLESHYPSREEYRKTGAEVSAAVRKGASYETELRMRRQDGSAFWAYLSGRAVDTADLSQGTVWAVLDITKRRQLEEDLNKSEEHYRQVVNNVTEGILVLQDGQIVFANPRVLQITGYTREEVIGLPMLTDVHPDDRAMVAEQVKRRERGEEVAKSYPIRIINRKLGGILWIEVSSVIIEWEGRPATLSFMTDITERRRLEDSLKHSMAESARLQTLQFQSELKQAESARRHAEDATRAKSMFLANMSHEIRTPMNAIIGMAHLALGADLNPKQQDYVEKIHGAGISLLGIINDILDFSKIEAGKLAIEQVDFSLDNVLSHVSTITSAKAHEKGLEYLFQIPVGIPRGLVGDPLRLGQILINLINNAVKFTERGEIRVGCRLLEMAEGKVQLEFVVRDSGIGMSAEQAGKLFRAFSQADGSTTRKYGGTGLGLSISKGIVELMDGAIWLESEADVGTTIHFSAWFGVAAEQARPQSVPPQIDGMRVLLVDDSQAARAILAETLSGMPVEIEHAASAEAALQAIRDCDAERPFGVVFTDQDMPGLDGIGLIAQIKKDAMLQAPPLLVLISADGRDEVRHRAEALLADGFLTKPVNSSTLVDTLLGLFAPTVESAPAKPKEDLPQFRDLAVLLVEDNEINQQIAKELMTSVGIEVDVAGNGRLALEKLLRAGPQHYGLVFMDVQMPEMDGNEATEQIRADARFARVPIIAMTAHAMLEERDRCLASGMNDHLTKPINPGQLYRTILRWCPDRASVQALAPMGSEACITAQGELIIDGFDVQDGLSRTLGDQAFYIQLLERFKQDQGDAAERIRQALAQGERKLAERLAHTLKGVAGMVSATRLETLAAVLEAGLRGDAQDDVLAEQLRRIEADMRALTQAMTRILPASAQPDHSLAPAGDVDAQAVVETVMRLARLLEQYDGEAGDFLSASAPCLVVALGLDAFKKMEQAVRKFDFDSALTVLKKSSAEAGYAAAPAGHT